MIGGVCASLVLPLVIIYLQYGNRSLLYTGDYNTASTHTAVKIQLASLPEADILITSSIYGDSSYPAFENSGDSVEIVNRRRLAQKVSGLE